MGQWALGLTHEEQGHYDQAIVEFRKAVTLCNGLTRILAGLAQAYAVAGKKDDALKISRKPTALSRQAYVFAYDMATIYAGLNEQEISMTWLQKAYEEHSLWLPFMTVDTKLKSLHANPRFNLLLDRMGLRSQ